MKSKLLSASLVFLLCSLFTYDLISLNASVNSGVNDPHFSGYLYKYKACEIETLDGANYVVEDRTLGITVCTGITSGGGQWFCHGIPGHVYKITCTYQGKVGCAFITQTIQGVRNIPICMTNYSTCINEE